MQLEWTQGWEEPQKMYAKHGTSKFVPRSYEGSGEFISIEMQLIR